MSPKRKAQILIIISLICIILNIIYEFDISDTGFWLRNVAFVCIIIANIVTIRNVEPGRQG